MWLNFIDTAFNFLLQGIGDRGLVGINFKLQKPERKVQIARFGQF